MLWAVGSIRPFAAKAGCRGGHVRVNRGHQSGEEGRSATSRGVCRAAAHPRGCGHTEPAWGRQRRRIAVDHSPPFRRKAAAAGAVRERARTPNNGAPRPRALNGRSRAMKNRPLPSQGRLDLVAHAGGQYGSGQLGPDHPFSGRVRYFHRLHVLNNLVPRRRSGQGSHSR